MINGSRHGNGKRWLLIALVVLGGFWLVNDAYRDGYYDALVQTGQITRVRDFDGGPDFPWGLLILGGLAYFAWRKGAFDRFSGPGGPFGSPSHERGIRPYDAGNVPGQPGAGAGFGPLFRGPRAVFDEWHRQAHEAERSAAPARPPAPQAPLTPPAPAAATGNGMSETPAGTPAPTPPAPEYWATMTRSPEAPAASDSGTSTVTTTEPAQGTVTAPNRPDGTAGPVLERW